jgi:hypothetical protein
VTKKMRQQICTRCNMNRHHTLWCRRFFRPCRTRISMLVTNDRAGAAAPPEVCMCRSDLDRVQFFIITVKPRPGSKAHYSHAEDSHPSTLAKAVAPTAPQCRFEHDMYELARHFRQLTLFSDLRICRPQRRSNEDHTPSLAVGANNAGKDG